VPRDEDVAVGVTPEDLGYRPDLGELLGPQGGRLGQELDVLEADGHAAVVGGDGDVGKVGHRVP